MVRIIEDVKEERIEKKEKAAGVPAVGKYEGLVFENFGKLLELHGGQKLLFEVKDLLSAGFIQTYAGPAQNINRIFVAGELPYYAKGSIEGVVVSYGNYASGHDTLKRGTHERPSKKLVARVKQWIAENVGFGKKVV